MSNPFEGSLQHHEYFEGGHLTFARCESCMYGSHFEVETWHSWAGDEDLEGQPAEYAERVNKQKCACDCAGPKEVSA